MKPTIAHTATHPRRRLACGNHKGRGRLASGKFDTNGSSMQSHPRAQPNSPALWGGGVRGREEKNAASGRNED